jgi:hypothetical protein
MRLLIGYPLMLGVQNAAIETTLLTDIARL